MVRVKSVDQCGAELCVYAQAMTISFGGKEVR